VGIAGTCGLPEKDTLWQEQCRYNFGLWLGAAINQGSGS
jgi:hypothetical protein